MKPENHIVVYEHQQLRHDRDGKFSIEHHQALEKYYQDGKHCPYFTLIRNGVQFNEHVGVLHVGNLLIEVLPKADKASGLDAEKKWRTLLIDMLRSVGSFQISATSNSTLKTKPNSILDLYIEMYIHELETILHRGLIKKYRSVEENRFALQGQLLFSKQIQQNLVHKERFYVSHTTYDSDHLMHRILYKALKLIRTLNSSSALTGRIGSLMLNFPELNDVTVTESTFDKISYNRKNQHYKTALSIAKLLLLNFHPDVSRGRHDVLALMFDMNKLWEKFIYTALRKDEELKVSEQSKIDFWECASGRSRMIADLIIEYDSKSYVIDTKWKNIEGYMPSPEDLRQLFAYLHYYNAEKGALVYPGENFNELHGKYFERSHDKKLECCSVITLPVSENVSEWQKKIAAYIKDWIRKQKQLQA